jgi:hypothetical protein
MTETETEHERKVREYWARAYGTIINNKDKDRPYEPTAVLASQRNTRKRSDIY